MINVVPQFKEMYEDETAGAVLEQGHIRAAKFDAKKGSTGKRSCATGDRRDKRSAGTETIELFDKVAKELAVKQMVAARRGTSRSHQREESRGRRCVCLVVLQMSAGEVIFGEKPGSRAVVSATSGRVADGTDWSQQKDLAAN